MNFLSVFQAYAGPAVVGSIANISGAIAFRLVLSSRAPGLQSRTFGSLLAGLLGGSLAIAESHVVVAVLDLRSEAAGLAFLFLPMLLAPTAVAALTWVLDDSSFDRGMRSGWTLVGAVAGAAGSASLVPYYMELLPGLPRALLGSAVALELLRFASGAVLGLPIALAATIGSAIADRVSRAATARVGRSPPN